MTNATHTTSTTALGLLSRFAEHEETTGVSAQAARNHYLAALRFAEHLGPVSLLDAAPEDIAGWLEGLGVGVKQRRRLISGLHAFYAWAERAELCVGDPARAFSIPRHDLRSPVAEELAELLHGWRVAQERRNLARSTIESRRNALRLFGGWLNGRSVLGAEPEDIEGWFDSRSLGPRARYRAISDLFAFYRWAIRHGYTASNPAADIDRPRLRVGTPRPISDEDLAHALEQAPPIIRAMLCLGAYEGLRCQEISGIDRSDVLDHVNPPLLRVVKGKGGKERLLPLHPAVALALNHPDLPRSGPLFVAPGRRGRPLRPNELSPLCNTFLHSVGIEATMHQLRHWFGSRLYAATKDLRMVQEMMGHSSPSTTAVYAAFNPGEAVGAVCGLAVAEAS